MWKACIPDLRATFERMQERGTRDVSATDFPLDVDTALEFADLCPSFLLLTPWCQYDSMLFESFLN